VDGQYAGTWGIRKRGEEELGFWSAQWDIGFSGQ